MPVDFGVRLWDGFADDQFIQLTEGSRRLRDALAGRSRRGSTTVERVSPWHTVVEVTHDAFRAGIVLPAASHYTGLGARHGLCADQAGGSLQLGADPGAYTGPDCPPDMLEIGGIPQGDYAPVPWLLASDGWAAWLETEGLGVCFELGDEAVLSVRGPLRVHLFTHATPFARLRAFLRLTGFPAVLPEWGYGYWKSRDIYPHQRDAEADYEGCREHEVPLDAIVLDSPGPRNTTRGSSTRTSSRTLRGTCRGCGRTVCRTVVWVAPWVNLESREGQYPLDDESVPMHAAPAPNYEPVDVRPRRVGEPLVAKWWMGAGSPVDSTSDVAEEWWR